MQCDPLLPHWLVAVSAAPNQPHGIHSVSHYNRIPSAVKHDLYIEHFTEIMNLVVEYETLIPYLKELLLKSGF
jgi:hypothetical protein